MNIFESLPHVQNCCFCIGLRFGSIIIVAIHFFFVVEAFFGSGSNAEFTKCYSSGMIMKILGYIAIAVAILLLVASVYFFIGVIKGLPDSVVLFMYASSILLIYNVIVSVFFFIEGTKKDCTPPYFFGGATLVSSLILCYFLVVLASFHRIMMYR